MGPKAAGMAENLALHVQRLQLGAAGGHHRRRARRADLSITPAAPAVTTRATHGVTQQQTEIRELLLPAFESSDHTTFLLQSENGDPAPGFQVAYGNALHSGAHLLAVVDEEGVVSIIDTSQHGQYSEQPIQPRSSILGMHPLIRPQSAFLCCRWIAHRNAVFDVIWSHDDRQLLTASGDLFVSGWDVETQRSVFKLQGHQMSVKCVRQVPAQAYLFASGARDGNVLIWDTRTNGKPVANLENVHSTPEQVVNPSNPTTFTSPPSARKRRKPPIAVAPRSVTCIEFGANGHELVTGGAVDSVVKFWDVRRLTTSDHFKPTAFSTRPVRTISCSSGSVVGGRANHGISSLAFDHTNSKLLVNVLNDAIKVIDIHAAPGAAPIIECSGHLATSFYVKAAFSPESDFIIGGSADGAAYIWNATTTKSDNTSSRSPRVALKGHTSDVNGVAWHKHDFTKVATCSDDGTVRSWSLHRSRHSDDKARKARDAKRFALVQDADGVSWSNWQEFCAQPDGFAYTTRTTPHSAAEENQDVSMDVEDDGDAREQATPVRKSPFLARRSGDLHRRRQQDAVAAAQVTPPPQRRRSPAPGRRPAPSPPQTLLDFWRR
ncbi:Denticleless protein, partial [Globisporangium splendens]